MKPKLLVSIVLAPILAPALLHGQGGSLTPPAGPIAPVMKTLDQIEARIPLVAGSPGVSIDGNGTISISQPGSYYLTGNLTIATAGAHGIVIAASHVTLDLNGFSLLCTSVNGGDAITLGASRGCRIRNGMIIGGTTRSGAVFTPNGWANGITRTGTDLDGSASDLVIRGIRNDAIIGPPLFSIGPKFLLVERCQVDTCGGDGIYAVSVADCQVSGVWGHAIKIYVDSPDVNRAGSVSNCFGESVGEYGDGISASFCSVQNSRGISVAGVGLAGQVVMNCEGRSTSGTGIAGNQITNSFGLSTSGYGIQSSSGTISNSRGGSFTNHGISGFIVNDSRGESGSGIGISAVNATNSHGHSATGSFGIQLTGTASFCRGNRPSGVAISAPIAIGCTVESGTVTSAQKHLGTP